MNTVFLLKVVSVNRMHYTEVTERISK